MLTFLTGATKVMVVFGRSYARTKAALSTAWITSLRTIGDFVELGGVASNPDDTLVMEGIRRGRGAHIDGGAGSQAEAPLSIQPRP